MGHIHVHLKWHIHPWRVFMWIVLQKHIHFKYNLSHYFSFLYTREGIKVRADFFGEIHLNIKDNHTAK